MTQQPPDPDPWTLSREELVRQARLRIRRVQQLAEPHRAPVESAQIGTIVGAVAPVLTQQWNEELAPAAEELYARSRELLQQLPYAVYEDLPPDQRALLSESEDVAADLGEHAQSVAQLPLPETGSQELTETLAAFFARLGGAMQDSAHRARGSNRHVAELARAEQHPDTPRPEGEQS